MSLPININTKKKKNIQGHMAAMRLGASPKVLNSYVTTISIILFVFYFYFVGFKT